MLDVRRMRVLREVAARGSFSAAAEALSYTQSAVSQQIAALERETGARLLERSARGVTPTEAGRALVAHADVILSRLADAEAELGAIAGLRGGRLRLTTFTTAGASIVPEVIAAFRDRHPGVELNLEPEDPLDNLATLRAGECDIAIVLGSSLDASRSDGDVELTHLLHDPMYLLLPVGHPLADEPAIALADLATDEWILGGTVRCPDGRILTRACQDAGFEPNISFHSDDYLAIQGFVAAGFGVSFLPDLALVAVRDDVIVRSLGARAPVRQVRAATMAGSWQSPAKRAMLDVLVEVSSAYQARRAELAPTH